MELKVELSQKWVAKVTGGTVSKLSKIQVTQNVNLRKFYTDKRNKPLDLQPKKTRGMCGRLNKHKEDLKARSSSRSKVCTSTSSRVKA
ncbi:hypothetical protein FD755_016117 [Muntiacus reevesi]|uniref:Large ribosomal subunit protein uL29 n=2 Tax=Muntiacus TaxID=9885 RepID=A0A5N3XIQ2_MUNRE|nr:hypothetical protein FD754_019030 [Muntiacus muntjak]KAB0372325.1 hypothetical protein FD755_016117 [Muntiacus reevesi]